MTWYKVSLMDLACARRSVVRIKNNLKLRIEFRIIYNLPCFYANVDD